MPWHTFAVNRFILHAVVLNDGVQILIQRIAAWPASTVQQNSQWLNGLIIHMRHAPYSQRTQNDQYQTQLLVGVAILRLGHLQVT